MMTLVNEPVLWCDEHQVWGSGTGCTAGLALIEARPCRMVLGSPVRSTLRAALVTEIMDQTKWSNWSSGEFLLDRLLGILEIRSGDVDADARDLVAVLRRSP